MEAIEIESVHVDSEESTSANLYHACENNNIKQVMRYIKSENINNIINEKLHPSGSTALHIAAHKGHTEIVKLLLKNGAFRSTTNKYGLTPFEEARTEETKDLFRRINTRHSFIGNLDDADYIEWVIADTDLVKECDHFRNGTDSLKRYDYLATRELLVEIISYYIKEYLVQNEGLSDAQIKEIEYNFTEALHQRDIIHYLIIAYTSPTAHFHKILNKHLAKYLMDYFDQKINFRPNYRLINCLKNIVALLIHHPDFINHHFIGITYRGMLMTENDLEKYQTGSQIMNRTFLSTSKKLTVAEFFAGEGQQNSLRKTPDRTHIQISVVCKYKIKNTRTALDIELMSSIPDEQEVLITPFATFNVTNVKRHDPTTNPSVLVEIELVEYESVCEPTYLCELIRHQHKQYSRIERLMNPSKSFPIEQSYINLAIVEAKEQQKKEKKLYDAQQSDAIIDKRYLTEQFDKSQVLWLLDGYDEIVQNVPAHLEYLIEQLLNTPHHILTSRPYLNKLSYAVVMEITGFTDDNIANACSLISTLPLTKPHLNLIYSLITALRDESEYVRWRACKALGNIDDKAATSEVIYSLITALRDESEYVRWGTCTALGNIGTKAATSEVVRALLTALGEQSENVRSSACEALGNIGDKAANSEVIRALITAFGDEHAVVRSSACEALGNMGDKVANCEVIRALVTALGDQSEDVRYSACEALGRISRKTATSEVIRALITALGNAHEDVRWRVCGALLDIVRKTATFEVIRTLGDKYATVRWRACEALGNMGDKAATSEVIRALLTALGDESKNIRYCACEALLYMGADAATSEVIRALLTALGDQSKDVRSSACEALENIDDKAATSEVIRALVTALVDDEQADGRSSARGVLVKVDEKASINDMTIGLQYLLTVDRSGLKENIAEVVKEASIFESAMRWVGSDGVSKIFVNEQHFHYLKTLSVEQLISGFFHTENVDWLPVITVAALVQGSAVTVTGKNIVVFGSKESAVVDVLSLNHRKLSQRLVEAFVDQARRLDLS
ncbi:unnamed protein product [Didymodactylos carnosus]|uniref:NAD(P)(+)--arginine ADP-ribosyltransferase n=1 Tax=Didymodactylos carnosus TaxID=1234261 RepID=A0A8S2GFS3_9BILA|nr:unnamed protein product [Didymodactylos carnosus]CAF3496047.1 unnamed protein product [Didymodactylos carnosus]